MSQADATSPRRPILSERAPAGQATMAFVALKATMVSSRARSVSPRFCDRSARKASLELPRVKRALAAMKSQKGAGKRRHSEALPMVRRKTLEAGEAEAVRVATVWPVVLLGRVG